MKEDTQVVKRFCLVDRMLYIDAQVQNSCRRKSSVSFFFSSLISFLRPDALKESDKRKECFVLLLKMFHAVKEFEEGGKPLHHFDRKATEDVKEREGTRGRHPKMAFTKIHQNTSTGLQKRIWLNLNLALT